LIENTDGLTVCVLLGSGAVWDEWKWPQELAELPGDEVPPITREDVVVFRQALRRLPTAHR
jgi:hypothetical protein